MKSSESSGGRPNDAATLARNPLGVSLFNFTLLHRTLTGNGGLALADASGSTVIHSRNDGCTAVSSSMTGGRERDSKLAGTSFACEWEGVTWRRAWACAFGCDGGWGVGLASTGPAELGMEPSLATMRSSTGSQEGIR